MTTAELESRVSKLEAEIALLKARLERSDAVGGIRRGLQAADEGRMAPAREVMERLRKKHNIAKP